MAPNDPVRIVQIVESVAVPDLTIAVPHSLTYYVEHIHRHLFNWSRWLGLAAVPVGETHRADRIGVGINAFQIDAGNNDWGAWVQILGSADTPITPDMVHYDLHEVFVTAAERIVPYFIQIAFGETAAGALAAGTYSELIYRADNAAQDKAPVEMIDKHVEVGTKAWARCLCPLQNTATLDFYIQVFEYEG